jgi:hypothetical protein
VLPKGITYNKTDGAYGTAVLSPIFRLNDQFADSQSDVVAEIRQNWNHILRDLVEFRDIFTEKGPNTSTMNPHDTYK